VKLQIKTKIAKEESSNPHDFFIFIDVFIPQKKGCQCVCFFQHGRNLSNLLVLLLEVGVKVSRLLSRKKLAPDLVSYENPMETES